MRYATLFFLLMLTACARTASSPEYEIYGAFFLAPSAVAVEAVMAEQALYVDKEVVVSGTVHAVCQQVGCWLTLQSLHGDLMRVEVPRTEDGAYACTVPTDISGRHAVAKGTVRLDDADAAAQHHYDEDASVPMAPTSLAMVATGVMIASK